LPFIQAVIRDFGAIFWLLGRAIVRILAAWFWSSGKPSPRAPLQLPDWAVHQGEVAPDSGPACRVV